jgi:hypothetical protein
MASSFKPCAVPKRLVLAASNISALPLDAMYEILLRLPAKDLCRLRLVCRLWRSHLSDPQFAVAHAAQHPGPLLVAGYAVHAGRDVLVEIMDLSGQIVKQVRGVQGDRVVRTSAAVDLVCVKKKHRGSGYRLLNQFNGDIRYVPDKLINPATGAVCQIPDGFAEEHVDLGLSLISEPKYLFGQVASTGEYKVFRKLFHFPLQFAGRQLFEIFTVSSSRHSGWRAIAPIEEGIQYSIFSSVVLDGILYSLCADPHKSITFDDRPS